MIFVTSTSECEKKTDVRAVDSLLNNFGSICVSVVKAEPIFSRHCVWNSLFESGDALLSTGYTAVGLKVIAHLVEVLANEDSPQAQRHGKTRTHWNTANSFEGFGDLR